MDGNQWTNKTEAETAVTDGDDGRTTEASAPSDDPVRPTPAAAAGSGAQPQSEDHPTATSGPAADVPASREQPSDSAAYEVTQERAQAAAPDPVRPAPTQPASQPAAGEPAKPREEPDTISASGWGRPPSTGPSWEQPHSTDSGWQQPHRSEPGWSQRAESPAGQPQGWQSGGAVGGPPTPGADQSRHSPSAKLPLVIAAAVVLVLAVAIGGWFVVGQGGEDPASAPGADPSQNAPSQTSDPSSGDPSTSPTDSESPTSSITPGQSRHPELHQGNRITGDAASYPRLRVPWSDRKRFSDQVINSSGQYVVLQRGVGGDKTSDWYANIFVGGLGTGIIFNGDPRPAATDLSLELRNRFYGSIPTTARILSTRAVNANGHKGWLVRQLVTTSVTGVRSPSLYLTAAVYDLGDRTAVAYVSDVPTNRPDLLAHERSAFRGLRVG